MKKNLFNTFIKVSSLSALLLSGVGEGALQASSNFLEDFEDEIYNQTIASKELMDKEDVEKKSQELGITGSNFREGDCLAGQLSQADINLCIFLSKILYKEGTRRINSEDIGKNIYLEETFKVMDVFRRHNKSEFSGLVLFNEKKSELIIDVAGSKSLKDWIRNFDARKAYSKNIIRKNELEPEKELKLHRGFLKIFEEIEPSFRENIRGILKNFKNKNPDKPLSIIGTGHSLGGALGELFTLVAINEANRLGISLEKHGIVTFGAPKVFNNKSVKIACEEMGGECNRLHFKNRLDLVPIVNIVGSQKGTTILTNKGKRESVRGAKKFNPHSSAVYHQYAGPAFSSFIEFKEEPKPTKVGCIEFLEEDSEGKPRKVKRGIKHRILSLFKS